MRVLGEDPATAAAGASSGHSRPGWHPRSCKDVPLTCKSASSALAGSTGTTAATRSSRWSAWPRNATRKSRKLSAGGPAAPPRPRARADRRPRSDLPRRAGDGFDPEARRRRGTRSAHSASSAKTILLTTHYLDQAERLSDWVAVLRDGEIVALGPPSELTSTLPGHRNQVPAGRRGRRPAHRGADAHDPRSDRADALSAGQELEGLEVKERVWRTCTSS